MHASLMRVDFVTALSALTLAAATGASATAARTADLTLREDPAAHTLSVHRNQGSQPLLTQHARPDFRPYIHPIVAPDGKGLFTEDSPAHHPHQTGLFWGFTRVNGRDYFHNPDGSYWRRVVLKPLVAKGAAVQWSTVYHLLDASGQAVLAETQVWTMRDLGDRYLLDLEWRGEACVDVTVSKYAYGGLFLRMPWRAGMAGEAVNSEGQSGVVATGQPARWVDVGMKIAGRSDLAHIAIFDHQKNRGHPLPWRIDAMLGVGPCRAIAGDWFIAKGSTEVVRHRLLVYTGQMDASALADAWTAFSRME